MEKSNTTKTKRNWCCDRCKESINIYNLESEGNYVIDGGNIFCSNTCKSAFKQHIPLRLNKEKKPIKYGKSKQKEKIQNKFKCFNCNKESNFMTWDKLCSGCRDTFNSINRRRIEMGEVLDLIGGLTNEQRSLIRLSKIN